jgi:hypothetical protein
VGVLAGKRWLIKVAVQHAMCISPRPEVLNYWFQRRVTHSVPIGYADFRRKFSQAVTHFTAFRHHHGDAQLSPLFFEFGAGWELVTPLAYYTLGIDRQVLVDLRPLAKLDLVNGVIQQFGLDRDELQLAAPVPLRPMPVAKLGRLDELETVFGIRYIAPADARRTGLSAQSIDFISSTSTMEHIPPNDLVAILCECARVLKSDGLLSCIIEPCDHYANFDSGISPYNFLRFSDTLWRFMNPSIHYQNRLRYPDYARLFDAAGLTRIAERIVWPTATDCHTIEEMPLAAQFQSYSVQDLGVREIRILAALRA